MIVFLHHCNGRCQIFFENLLPNRRFGVEITLSELFPRSTTIIATVKGDIHDIGKNIVKVLLENYGFYVVDLGRDVDPETVVNASTGAKMVALSALMTTTVPQMEETIKLLRKTTPKTKIMVGGAVLTQTYADMIGADFYGKDAMDAVRIAQKVFE